MSEDEPIPGSVFNPRQVRTLKLVVIGLTILLVLGFALLIAGLYYQATKIGEERQGNDARRVGGAAAGGEVDLPVPAGAQVQSVRVDGGRVVLHVKGTDGEQILIVDTARGNRVTTLRLVPR
jgi:hypothetical protein